MQRNGDLISSTTNANFIFSCLTIGIHHQSNGKWYYFDGKLMTLNLGAISQAAAQLYSGVDTVSPTVALFITLAQQFQWRLLPLSSGHAAANN